LVSFYLAGVHIIDLPVKWDATFYISIAYVAVIIFSVVVIERLIVKGSGLDQLGLAGALVAVLFGDVVNRTVGMPRRKGGIGNWFELLGLLSL
jgi:hypothetical protein